ncbi:MAG: carboxypeptidase regulatory-like domain-containing protein, partial [Gemmatimonadota bacterium]
AMHMGLVIVLLAVPTPTIAQAGAADTTEAGNQVCRVFGRVLDAASGDPVVGASVWLESADDGLFLAGRETSTDGSFSMETAACEPALLRVTMIGYTDAADPVSFDGADRLRSVTIRLGRDPIALEELRVEIPRSLRLRDAGFYARKAWVEASGKDLGQFLDPREVEGRSAAIQTVMGIVGDARISTIYGRCPGGGPSYYIDGRWWRADRAAIRMLRYGILPEDIEGIEIYRPIHGSVPEEYRDPNSSTCGAVVIWTKEAEAAEAPQIEVELCEPSDDPQGISFGGVVSDELTGVRLPASYVTLTIIGDGDREDREVETIADDDGRYRYCDLGAWPSTVQARYGSATAEPFGIDSGRARAGYWEVDLKLGVVRPASVVGVVTGQDLDVTGVEVSLEGTEVAVAPDDRGYFEIHDVMPGDHVVAVRRGEEILIRRDVSLRSGATEAVTLDLDVP